MTSGASTDLKEVIFINQDAAQPYAAMTVQVEDAMRQRFGDYPIPLALARL